MYFTELVWVEWSRKVDIFTALHCNTEEKSVRTENLRKEEKLKLDGRIIVNFLIKFAVIDIVIDTGFSDQVKLEWEG